MHRFTDIESTPKRLTPVYGYLAYQLLPLQKTLEPILSQVNQLDRFSKIAKNECHFPSEHGLTRDESAAVFLYTMEWGENSFYQVINRALRAEDRSSLKPWFAYLKLFDTAVQKLPTVRKNLWRGVARDIAKNYKKGDEFTWWTISSCSTSVNIIKDFLGPNSTLFLIEATNGKDVSNYTNYPNENEVILCPGTRFRVVSDPLDQPPMHLVHLQEVTDDTEEQLTTSFHAMAVTSSPKTESSHMTDHVQSSPVQIHTDKSGNRYEGEMKDGKKHGKGKMDYVSGDKYVGMWVNDTITGQGICIWTNGNRYEGQWRDNKKHGKGTMNHANGEKYTGDWLNDKRNGRGTTVWASNTKGAGDKYEGDYVDDVRTGQGVYTYANGNLYEGQFKDNKMHGKGTMNYANSDKYTGDWLNDKRNGRGTTVWGSNTQGAGDKYEGDYVDDVRTGQGVYTFANGNLYEGQWKDNKMHGRGTMNYANGNKYIGDWVNDKKHGKGIYIWGRDTQWAGDKYEGDWFDDNRTGQGVYTYANGNRYEGQFKGIQMHGRGKMKYANGTVKEGMWSDGNFIG